MCPSNKTLIGVLEQSGANMSLKERVFAKRKTRLKQNNQEKVSPTQEESKGEMENPDESWWSSYGEDLFSTLCAQESAWPNLSLRSPQLGYRGALINKIRESAVTIEASEATVFLAVRYLDRFMMDHDINPQLLSYVALTTLLMAAKVEDSWDVVKKCATLRKTEEGYDGSSLKLEWNMCFNLQWRLATPTILSFAKVAASNSTYNKDFRNLLEQFLDIALKDKHLSLPRPSVVGVGCVYATWRTLKPDKDPDDLLPKQVLGDESFRQSVKHVVERLLRLRALIESNKPTNKLKRTLDEANLRTDFMKISLNAPPAKHIKIAVT